MGIQALSLLDVLWSVVISVHDKELMISLNPVTPLI